MTKRPATQRVGGLRADPDTVEWLERAATNQAARTPRQRHDAARIRVRIDVPRWLIDRLDQLASDQNTSRNQLAAFLLAWAAARYLEQDPDLDALLAAAATPSRSINVDCDLNLAPVKERLQK